MELKRSLKKEYVVPNGRSNILFSFPGRKERAIYLWTLTPLNMNTIGYYATVGLKSMPEPEPGLTKEGLGLLPAMFQTMEECICLQ